MDSDITTGTVDEVLARVGSDKDLAAAALELEEGKAESKRRATLIEGLERIILADDTVADDTTESDDGSGPETFVAEGADRPSDYPRALHGSDKVGPEVFRITR